MDAEKAFQYIEGERPAAIISYADPSDPELKSQFNRNAVALLERFRRSAAFTERALGEDPAIRIFEERTR
jgi:hypothetical protein